MIICISGYTGSGKTFIGGRLAKALKIRHVAYSYKDYASSHQETLNLLRKADKNFAKKFDRKVIAEAKRQSCVVTTWLGPWMIKDSTLNIWLDASVKERARRKANELKMSLPKATKYVNDNDKMTMKHFKDAYKIDFSDKRVFDLQINTEKLKIDQIVSIIAFLSLEKEGKRFD